MAMVATVVIACLAGGVRVWERAKNFGEVEGAALIALEEIERNLRNMHYFQAIPFEGTPGSLVFPGMVRKISLGETGVERQIGAIKYQQPSSGAGLIRKEWPYPDAEPPDFSGDEILPSLNSLDLSFYKEPDKNSAQQGIWTDTWSDNSNSPSRVEIELVCNKGEDELITIRRMILIPSRPSQGEE